jgi:hypothetical protein
MKFWGLLAINEKPKKGKKVEITSGENLFVFCFFG